MSLLVTTPAVRPESRASFANFTLSMLSGSPPPKELYACGWEGGVSHTERAQQGV